MNCLILLLLVSTAVLAAPTGPTSPLSVLGNVPPAGLSDLQDPRPAASYDLTATRASPEEGAETSFTEMPVDVLYAIFKHLAPGDQMRLKASCTAVDNRVDFTPKEKESLDKIRTAHKASHSETDKDPNACKKLFFAGLKTKPWDEFCVVALFDWVSKETQIIGLKQAMSANNIPTFDKLLESNKKGSESALAFAREINDVLSEYDRETPAVEAPQRKTISEAVLELVLNTAKIPFKIPIWILQEVVSRSVSRAIM